MSSKVALGGKRLGSGKKMDVHLHGFERSTHDQSYIWRSTMAPGTLVPFMVQVGLPGTTMDIDLNADIKTYPTVGPLFGSYKLQMDVFSCPVRLYQGQLHNNKQKIGLKMSNIKLPQLYIESAPARFGTQTPIDLQQVGASNIHRYLGLKGLGHNRRMSGMVKMYKNAIPYLAYWDIYKNYYANQQEEIGMYIHNDEDILDWSISSIKLLNSNGQTVETFTGNNITERWGDFRVLGNNLADIDIIGDGLENSLDVEVLMGRTGALIRGEWEDASNVFNTVVADGTSIELRDVKTTRIGALIGGLRVIQRKVEKLQLKSFPLENLDTMRDNILMNVSSSSPFIVNESSITPYGDSLGAGNLPKNQEGLAIKTYQADMYNNWLSTEWIDGTNGINAITAIDTSSGEFTLDTLIMSRKVYDMLNRIAVSGGSYEDWLTAVYDHQGNWRAETPVYMGGMSQEIIFQEVVSNASGENSGGEFEPLGTLAGRGNLSQGKKGGKVTIKFDEPTFVIGIVSITPRIDYSQGNEWFTRLETMDDFHKPSLDQIGFQELITDEMAWWSTIGSDVNSEPTYMSAGKQPAWINYQTEVNKTYGNFADERKEMYMTLNRRYEMANNGLEMTIKDLTTYIDPTKFNYMWADTSLDAQNFWVQIAIDNIVRRKMSAKIMPNL